MKHTRRQFMQAAAATSLMLGAPFIHADDKVDRIYSLAIIGAGWWGRNVLREAIASKRCKLTAMCDVDGDSLESSLDQMGDLAGTTP